MSGKRLMNVLDVTDRISLDGRRDVAEVPTRQS